MDAIIRTRTFQGMGGWTVMAAIITTSNIKPKYRFIWYNTFKHITCLILNNSEMSLLINKLPSYVMQSLVYEIGMMHSCIWIVLQQNAELNHHRCHLVVKKKKKNQQWKISLGFLNTHAESSQGPVNCELKFHFTVGLCMFSLIKHTPTHTGREIMSLGEYYFHLSDFISGLIMASTKYEI